MQAKDVSAELRKKANPEKAKLLQRFFKTGKGEYGEGDIFLGVVVPEQRKIARKYENLGLQEIKKLIRSKIHEERLTALIILVSQFRKSKDENAKKIIFDFYLANSKNINSWDLVDLSAPNIVGSYLLDKDKSILFKLAESDCLWERRIAVLATFAFIKEGVFEESLKIAGMLIDDKEDLIHKAVGWMLREIGKKNQEVEEDFLKKHCRHMPRTMLRYAIEKFNIEKRKAYLEC